MNQQSRHAIHRTTYDAADCAVGIVHLGFGAFHRAHQAVYIDDYMDKTGDLAWGIAAVNLRKDDAAEFHKHTNPYLLKTTTPEGEASFREVRPHVHFADWSADSADAEALLGLESVKIVSITVTESGYYLNDDWTLNSAHPVIQAEIAGTAKTSVYAYLAAALKHRIATTGAPITILCCDNIRSNGTMLARTFRTYLQATNQPDIADWLDQNATFPCSMVDRITPRATEILQAEVAALSPTHAQTAIHGESFIQWVLKDEFATDFPALDRVGVEIVKDVDPYEEAKIRILNGGHTGLCYLGALAGYQTFDQVMTDPKLRAHFDAFETDNVLPGLTLDLPFSKTEYRDMIAKRFSNAAIADDLARICMDGWSKFPIFVRPTLDSCLAQGIDATPCYDSIASWVVYARRFKAGKTHIPYVEPYWSELEPLLPEGQEHAFAQTEALWSDLPQTYPDFADDLANAITRLETAWPL